MTRVSHSSGWRESDSMCGVSGSSQTSVEGAALRKEREAGPRQPPGPR